MSGDRSMEATTQVYDNYDIFHAAKTLGRTEESLAKPMTAMDLHGYSNVMCNHYGRIRSLTMI
jgi:hypothetical protein